MASAQASPQENASKKRQRVEDDEVKLAKDCKRCVEEHGFDPKDHGEKARCGCDDEAEESSSGPELAQDCERCIKAYEERGVAIDEDFICDGHSDSESEEEEEEVQQAKRTLTKAEVLKDFVDDLHRFFRKSSFSDSLKNDTLFKNYVLRDIDWQKEEGELLGPLLDAVRQHLQPLVADKCYVYAREIAGELDDKGVDEKLALKDLLEAGDDEDDPITPEELLEPANLGLLKGALVKDALAKAKATPSDWWFLFCRLHQVCQKLK